jgi:hypothetical protein
VKAIRSYSTTVDADLAKIALDAAGVPSLVVGIGVPMEGGPSGVQLLVPDECVEAAVRVLERSSGGQPLSARVSQGRHDLLHNPNHQLQLHEKHGLRGHSGKLTS